MLGRGLYEALAGRDIILFVADLTFTLRGDILPFVRSVSVALAGGDSTFILPGKCASLASKERGSRRRTLQTEILMPALDKRGHCFAADGSAQAGQGHLR